MDIEKGTIKAVASVMQIVANENRLRILVALQERPKTWTELMFELKMNPKTLEHHLVFLRKNGLVGENKPHGFRLTEAGQTFMRMSVQEIIHTARKAEEIVRRHNR